MPELPDIVVYVESLQRRIVQQPLQCLNIVSPFLVRSVEPPIEEAVGKTVLRVSRIGKRIVLGLEDHLFLVFHLMIAGRFRWLPPGAKGSTRMALARLAFPTGTLLLTEASKNKRASLHLVRGRNKLAELDPGGLDVLRIGEAEFRAALRRENRTLKRTLTDPRVFSGIGNAYSDEILHAARLSPFKLTRALADDEIARLRISARDTLEHWIATLRRAFADRFPGPGDVTAFRNGFAVHGRYQKPCPACGATVQRIRYAESETNYCPHCQTGGRILADRSLSRLLRNDWPRSAGNAKDP